jgi:hypothetical protein
MGCVAVTPVARIREMPVSNLDRVPTILTEVFCGIPQSFKANCGIAHWLCHDRFLPNASQFVQNFSLRNIYVSGTTETAWSTDISWRIRTGVSKSQPQRELIKTKRGSERRTLRPALTRWHSAPIQKQFNSFKISSSESPQNSHTG